jgi:hypothetical protein
MAKQKTRQPDKHSWLEDENCWRVIRGKRMPQLAITLAAIAEALEAGEVERAAECLLRGCEACFPFTEEFAEARDKWMAKLFQLEDSDNG